MAERRYTLVFYVAILTAAGATFGVYRVLESTKAKSKVPTQSVVIASQDLPEGASIARTALSVGQWPVPTVPVGAFTTPDSLVGRVTRVAIFKGEPIVPGRLAPNGTGPGLEVKITPGKRAMAMRINDAVGVSGLIQPNSRVDVMVTIQDDDIKERVSKLFMTNMRVLSVGSHVQRGADGKPIEASTATLEVTPEEAERLGIAMRQGAITLVLRGYGDPDSISTPGARAEDVLAQLRSAPTRRIEPPPRQVAVRPARRTAPAAAPGPPIQQVVVVPPRKPDSLTVQVIRSGKSSSTRVEKSDSTANGNGGTGHNP